MVEHIWWVDADTLDVEQTVAFWKCITPNSLLWELVLKKDYWNEQYSWTDLLTDW